MRPNSSINKASDFWSGTKVSDIVMGIFNCGCGPRETKDQKHSMNNQFMDTEDSLSPSKPYRPSANRLKGPIQPKSLIPHDSFTDSFEQNLKKIQNEDRSFTSEFDAKDNRSREPLSSPTAADEDQEKRDLPEESLVSGSKKISKRSRKTAYFEQEKKASQSRRAWQPQEDQLLLELHKELGPAWAAISKRMGGTRNGKQIRDRYLNKLDPQLSNTEWTEEEDNLLVSLYYQLGKKWSEIAKKIPGRSESMIKNRVQWRFRWMMTDNTDNSEQFKSPSNTHESTNAKITPSTLDDEYPDQIISEEPQRLEMNQVQGQPAEMMIENSSLVLESRIPSLEKLSVDLYGVPEKNQQYGLNNDIGASDYYDKRGTYHQQMNGPSSTDDLSSFFKGAAPMQRTQQQLGLYSALPSIVNYKDVIEDERMGANSYLLEEAHRNYPPADSWQGDLPPGMIMHNNQIILKEDATRRVEELRKRLVNLEGLLKVTYQEVFKAQGAFSKEGL